MTPGAKKLLKHEVVGVFPLVKKHWRREAHRTNKERQPATVRKVDIPLYGSRNSQNKNIQIFIRVMTLSARYGLNIIP